MPSWKRIVVSGSDATLNTLTVSNGITGSLQGTASYATQAISASFATTASYASTYAAVFPYTGSAIISGSLAVTGSIRAIQTTTSPAGYFQNNAYSLGGNNPIIAYDGLGYTVGLGYGTSTDRLWSAAQGLYIGGHGNFGVYFERSGFVSSGKARIGDSNFNTGTTLELIGTGATSATSTLLVQNSSAVPLLKILNDGTTTISGSLRITGSLSVTAGITGSLLGTASYATQALSASFAPSTPAFPFTGSAIITGSLTVTGSFNVTGLTTRIGNTTLNGNLVVTGSLLLSGSSLVAGITPIPLEGTIQDGVTSVLGNLNDWNSSFYQGTVLYSETAAGTITFGQLCYRTQNETWELADASVFGAASTYMLGICVKSSTATNPTSILINGFVETAAYAAILKTGEPLYMTTTPGSMSKSVPSASGNIVRIIGHTFWDSNTNTKIIIRFNPENSWIELT